MSSPDWRDYRTQIHRLRDLTIEARKVATEACNEDYPAKNVRRALYNAVQNLDQAAQFVYDDLIDADPTDRDLS